MTEVFGRETKDELVKSGGRERVVSVGLVIDESIGSFDVAASLCASVGLPNTPPAFNFGDAPSATVLGNTGALHFRKLGNVLVWFERLALLVL